MSCQVGFSLIYINGRCVSGIYRACDHMYIIYLEKFVHLYMQHLRHHAVTVGIIIAHSICHIPRGQCNNAVASMPQLVGCDCERA